MPLKTFFPLLFLTLTLACSSVTKLHQTPKGLALHPLEGVRLDVAYVAPEIKQIQGRTVEVRVFPPPKTIDPATAKIRQFTQPDEWETWRQDFQKTLADALWRTGLFSDVSTPNDPQPLTDPDLRFDFAMTEWNEGTGWKRFIIGFGAGRTRMQWEGALIDPRTHTPLFAFGDNRAHPGGPSMMGLNFRPFHGGTLIAEDLRWGIGDLTRALHDLTGSPAEKKEGEHPTTHKPQSAKGITYKPMPKPPAPRSALPANPLNSAERSGV